jgi:hypothetical protein
MAPDKVYELSTTDFSVVRSVASPSTTPTGIGGDNTVIWHGDYNTDLIYELDEAVVIEKTSSDTGSGLESLGDRIFGAVDGGSGVEALSLLAELIKADGGSGLDALVELIQLIEKLSSDAGSGIDALTALDVALIESDTASGLDFALLSASLLAADLGLGLDEVTALAKALLATDLGIGSDRLVAKIESPSREGAIRLPPEGRKISIPSREVYL